jgi:hypothetical protein
LDAGPRRTWSGLSGDLGRQERPAAGGSKERGRTCQPCRGHLRTPNQSTEAVTSTPAPQAKTKSKEPAFIPRHWHDNAAPGYTIRKRSAGETTAAQSKPVEKAKQGCSQDGLSPLLRKLNLQPNCEL